MTTPEIAALLTGVSELLLLLFKRSPKKFNQENKKSLAIIWVVIALSIFSAFWCAAILHASIGSPSEAGAAVFIAGMLIRWVAILQLGNRFTVNVSIVENHSLKADGLYKYIRHPSYLGSMAMFAGLGLMLNNYYSLGMIVLLPLLVFIYRITIEESVLESAFQVEYSNYRKRTWKLLPMIY